MQATLIYNPNSGNTGQLSLEELVEGLAQAGYTPIYEATSSEADLDPILAKAEGLVVAAGGDGTVRAVVTRLVGKGLPLALIPLGTANNIWNTFSIQAGPREAVASLKNPARRYFDIGAVRSPWGQDYFLEGFGFGLYADTLAAYQPEKGKSPIRSINAIIETLGKDIPHQCWVWLDGEQVSGDFLLFEALNTKAVGPRLKLAPGADPADGLLDIVRIKQENRDSLLEYLLRMLTEDLEGLPSVEVSRGRRIEILCEDAFPFHVDAEIRPQERVQPDDRSPVPGLHRRFPASDRTTLVEVLPRAIELWLPQPPEAAESSDTAGTRLPDESAPPPPPLHVGPL